MGHDNYVKLSQLCGDTAYRNAFECGHVPLPAVLSKGAGMGGR